MIEPLIKLVDRVPALYKFLNRSWYNYVDRLGESEQVQFMNLGYLNPEEPGLMLDTDDPYHQVSIQLYHHVARATDWTGKTALEVGCGRGGGAAYVFRTFGPARMIGLDQAKRSIAFCQHRYADLDGLSFQHGDAENLSFPEDHFDVILNVESSHAYPLIERFYDGVARTLKPDGVFLCTDFGTEEEWDYRRRLLAESGLAVVAAEDIGPHVIRALDALHEAKQHYLAERVPKPLHGLFAELSGLRGSTLLYGSFLDGTRQYLNWVVRHAK